MAGDLWLLFIQLAGKMKRADEVLEKITLEENQDLVEDFLESGERLWVRVKKLLRLCEKHMFDADVKANGGKGRKSMSKDSGKYFVDAIFGRGEELEKTERIMGAMRLWSLRVDVNCDEILQNPTIGTKSPPGPDWPSIPQSSLGPDDRFQNILKKI